MKRPDRAPSSFRLSAVRGLVLLRHGGLKLVRPLHRNGHMALRQTSNGSCLECCRLRGLRDDVKAKSRESWKLRSQRQYEIFKERVARNPEAYLGKRRENYERNREKILGRQRDNYKRNPDPWLKSSRNRKARKKGADGTHSLKDIGRILKQQSSKCAYCKIELKNKYHVDHIVPLARGGTNWPNNLQILCATCNLQKKDQDPIDFARRKGRLL
ncbi:HNH endonuclease [Methylorubrum sp. B1-46]|uniref:HNH endonuclease n=1 Tax=Methylorubrum sp. B1-46 TaxID=2897334 RepID=UPI00351CC86E